MNQIMEGARTCFVAKGFHGSSIAQISDAARVSIANIYQYYPSKQALVVAVVEADLARHLELINRFIDTDYRAVNVEATLRELFTTEQGHKIAVLRAEIVSEGSRNDDVAKLLRDAEASFTQVFLRGVEAGQQDGRLPADVRAADVVERIALLFEGAMRLYIFAPDEGANLLARLAEQVERTVYPEP